MDALDLVSNQRQILATELELMLSCYSGSNYEIMAALADKIQHMCLNIGCPSSVKPMLQSMVNGRVKMWATGIGYYGSDKIKEKGTQLHGCSTGRIHRTWAKDEYVKGHFRWNHTAYMLLREDRDFLREFFFENKRVKKEGICGIVARYINPYRISENTIRIEIQSPKGNEYALYYYKDKDQLQANWLRENVEGVEKEKIINMLKRKFGESL